MPKFIQIKGRGNYPPYKILIHESNTMNNRYKLKQWYPGLRKDMSPGDEVVKSTHIKLGGKEVEDYVFEGEEAPFFIPQTEVEDNPDFWEEIKLDYQIVKLKSEMGCILTFNEEGKCIKRTDRISTNITRNLEAAVASEYNTIYSVKRLSDGEVFTIGDKVKEMRHGTSAIIDEFNVSKHYGMLVHATKGSYAFNQPLKRISKVENSLFVSDDGVQIYEGDHYFVPQKNDPNTFSGIARKFVAIKTKDYSTDDSNRFSTREAAEKFIKEQTEKPLFTTEDGVDIYERDIYWLVRTDPNIAGKLWTVSKHSADSRSGGRQGYMYFSTREDAEAFIRKFKPRYSNSFISGFFHQKAKDFYEKKHDDWGFTTSMFTVEMQKKLMNNFLEYVEENHHGS